jgi:hypothetical protein
MAFPDYSASIFASRNLAVLRHLAVNKSQKKRLIFSRLRKRADGSQGLNSRSSQDNPLDSFLPSRDDLLLPRESDHLPDRWPNTARPDIFAGAPETGTLARCGKRALSEAVHERQWRADAVMNDG